MVCRSVIVEATVTDRMAHGGSRSAHAPIDIRSCAITRALSAATSAIGSGADTTASSAIVAMPSRKKPSQSPSTRTALTRRQCSLRCRSKNRLRYGTSLASSLGSPKRLPRIGGGTSTPCSSRTQMRRYRTHLHSQEVLRRFRLTTFTKNRPLRAQRTSFFRMKASTQCLPVYMADSR